MGSLGLIVFAVLVWRLLPVSSPALVLIVTTAAWMGVSVAIGKIQSSVGAGKADETKPYGMPPYAVIGLGHIAQVAVLPGFKNAKNSELVALLSADPEKQRKLAQPYNVERVYSYERYDECLSQGIDAVYIALPNHLHRDSSIRALMAGCRAEHAHVPRRASQCSCVGRASTALA